MDFPVFAVHAELGARLHTRTHGSPWPSWGPRAMTKGGTVSNLCGTPRPRGGRKTHEHGMVCSCTPAMDEPQRQAWAPHVARGETAPHHSPPVQRSSIADGLRHPARIFYTACQDQSVTRCQPRGSRNVPRAETQRLAAGTPWMAAVFERMRCPSRATVRLVAWAWLDEAPESRLRLQLTGQEAPASLPARGLGFGRGHLVACGRPDPAHEAARAAVEATMRSRVAALAATAQSPSPTTPPVFHGYGVFPEHRWTAEAQAWHRGESAVCRGMWRGASRRGRTR